MDNRIFNVNGKGDAMLLDALKLVFQQDGVTERAATCDGWFFSADHGLVLVAWVGDNKRTNRFPASLTAEECLPFVTAWLKGKDAKTVKREGWDANTDHDGSNGEGWRVYCEDWGHVANEFSAICAIKPVVLWYGK